jgi:pyrrolidone-carboxylate peptidase
MLERISRGRRDISFPESMAKGNRRILISGFDPFGFQWSDPDQPGGMWNRRQGNPSGAAVLALDGKTIQEGKVKGRVEGVIFPVRFADFDQGIVESTFSRYLRGKNSVDMIMTISQGDLKHHEKGRDEKHPNRRKRLADAFELEKWAGKRRTSGASDNLGKIQSGKPRRGKKRLRGPEFLKSSLPRKEIIKELRRRGKRPGKETEDETEFMFRPKLSSGYGPVETGGKPMSLPKQPGNPPQKARSVEGSGGGYLSNEIFYRTALLRRGNKKKGIAESKVPVGHLHVPLLPPPTSKDKSKIAYVTLLKKIINMVLRIIKLALPNIGA